MASAPPDPSTPDQFEQRVREIAMNVLSDPLGYPDQMTTWLAQFVQLNTLPTLSTTATPPPPS